MRVNAISKSSKIEFHSQPTKPVENEYLLEGNEHPKRLSLWQRVLNAFRDEEVISKEEDELKAGHIDHVV